MAFAFSSLFLSIYFPCRLVEAAWLYFNDATPTALSNFFRATFPFCGRHIVALLWGSALPPRPLISALEMIA